MEEWADLIFDTSKAVAEFLSTLEANQAAVAKVIYKDEYRSFTVFYPVKE